MRDDASTYANFRPTQFDRAGAFLGVERADWLVAPVGRNRDSGPLDESNFATALEMLGDESERVEVHSFNHWAVGWFEIILVDPGDHDTVCKVTGDPDCPVCILKEMKRNLDNYPVLDESDWSEREFDGAMKYWDSESTAERVRLCQEAGVSIFGARPGRFPADNNGYLYEILRAD